MQIDVVCGGEVDPSTALCVEHEGKAYYFCSDECLEAFRESPEDFDELPPGLDSKA